MFNFSNLRMTETVEESKALNEDGIPQGNHLRLRYVRRGPYPPPPEAQPLAAGVHRGVRGLSRGRAPWAAHLLEGARECEALRRGDRRSRQDRELPGPFLPRRPGSPAGVDRGHQGPQAPARVHRPRRPGGGSLSSPQSVAKLGFTAHAPQYTEVYDLIEDQIVAPGYLPERKAKACGRPAGQLCLRASGGAGPCGWWTSSAAPRAGTTRPLAAGRISSGSFWTSGRNPDRIYLPAGYAARQRGRCSPLPCVFKTCKPPKTDRFKWCRKPKQVFPVHIHPCRCGIENHLNSIENKRDKSHGSIGKRQRLYRRY